MVQLQNTGKQVFVCTVNIFLMSAIWQYEEVRGFLLCLSITYIYFEFKGTFRIFVWFSDWSSSLNTISCWISTEGKSESTGTRLWATKHKQETHSLTSTGLTDRTNSIFNIYSIIIFLSRALENWVRPYPSMNNLHKAAYTKTAATLMNFRSSAGFIFWTICKPFPNCCKVGVLFPPLFFGTSGSISH